MHCVARSVPFLVLVFVAACVVFRCRRTLLQIGRGGGVGTPIRSLDSRRESTKTPGAGDASTGHPGWGVPEHIRAMRSFPRRMHNVALLTPVASLDCAYFLSPRGVPNALSAFPANPIGSPLTRFVHPRNTAFHVGVSV